MPSSIRPDKALGKEIRRIAAARLEEARWVLEDQPEGSHEAIHVARKQFKRVRGLYRLIARGHPSFHKAENDRIRAMARSLSAARDRTALVETARRLAISAETADEHMAVIRICERLVERRDADFDPSDARMKNVIAEAIETCRAATAALKGLDLDGTKKGGADLLASGWQRTSGKAQKALAAARETGDAESFHTLRKRSQDRWMQCGFLREAWPSLFNAARLRTKRLVKTLGEKQDIAVLDAFLQAQAEEIAPAEDMARLIAVMIREGDRRRDEALKLAADVFAGSAERDSAALAKLWRAAARWR